MYVPFSSIWKRAGGPFEFAYFSFCNMANSTGVFMCFLLKIRTIIKRSRKNKQTWMDVRIATLSFYCKNQCFLMIFWVFVRGRFYQVHTLHSCFKTRWFWACFFVCVKSDLVLVIKHQKIHVFPMFWACEASRNALSKSVFFIIFGKTS